MSNSPATSIVKFDAAMNMAKNIVAKEVTVTGEKIAAVRKLSLISEFIEKNTADVKSPIIQFLSSYDGEGVDRISADLAVILSGQYGKKVLLLDACARSVKGIISQFRQDISISINDLCTQTVSGGDTPFLNVRGTSLFYASLIDVQGFDTKLVDMTTLKKFLTAVRANFDIVLIASEQSISNELSYSLSNIVQLNVLVVSAKKTRKQVVSYVVKSISDRGGKIGATILSHRTFFIPQIVYRFLFSTS